MRHLWVFTLALGILSFTLASCGGGGTDPRTQRPKPDIPTDEPDIVDTVEDVSVSPDVPPDVPPKTDVEDVSETPDVEDVLEVPDVSDVEDVPEVPDVEDVPDIPEIEDVPADIPEDIPEDVPEDIPEDIGGDTGEVVGPPCTWEYDCQAWAANNAGPCERAICDMARGVCLLVPGSGAECDDEDPCTEDDVCTEGVCAGTPKTYDNGDDCDGVESCDPETGEMIPGEPMDCEDGNFCTLNRCVPGVGCVLDGPVQCNESYCDGFEECDPAIGCVIVEEPFCNDNLACNGVEGCIEEWARNGDPNACIIESPAPVCGDDLFCNGEEVCAEGADGQCPEGEAWCCLPGSNPCPIDDGNVCNGVHSCVEANVDPQQPEPHCKEVPPPQCSDGLSCNGFEFCNPENDIDDEGNEIANSGGCDSTPDHDCGDDGNVCNGITVCQEGNAGIPQCVDLPAPSCNDGNPCSGQAVCDPSRVTDPAHPEDACLVTVQPPECDDGDPCNGSEYCDPMGGGFGPQGLCKTEEGTDPQCDDGLPCNGVESCNSTDGTCIPGEPVECDDGDPCNGMEVCDDEQGGICVDGPPPACDDDNLCNGQYECNSEMGGCVLVSEPIECLDSDLCDGTLTCNPTTGNCEPGEPLNCDDDNDCTIDDCHYSLGCQNVPVDAGPCDNGDPCTIDDWCAADTCMAGHAICKCPDDDSQEPDDNAGQATLVAIDRGRLNDWSWDGVICGANEDWFRFDALEGDALVLSLSHNAQYGDIDVRIEDEVGTLLAVRSEDGEDDLELALTAAAVGPLYLVITGDALEDFENFYALSVEYTPAGVCVEDELENNDDYLSATPLVGGERLDARICPLDPDFFGIELDPDLTLVVDVTYTPTDAPVVLDLLDSAGNVYATGTGFPGALRIQQQTIAATTLYPRVSVVGDAEASYSLVTTLYDDPEQCVEDLYAPNHLQADGYPVGWGQTVNGFLCPSVLDWYAIELLDGDEITIDLRFDNANHDLNLYLHEPPLPGQTQGRAARLSINDLGYDEQITHRIPDDGVWGIKVLGRNGASTDYQLTITGSGGSLTCQEDAFEPNDTDGTGPRLRGGQGLVGALCPDDPDWFVLPLSEGDVATVTLDFPQAEFGHLDLELRDTNSQVVASANGAGTSAELNYEALQSGDYSLGVIGANADSTNSYTLRVEVDYAVPPCDEDTYEDNDSQEEATSIPLATTYQARRCPSDDDWYVFPVDPTQRYSVTMTWEGDDLACELVHRDGTRLADCEATGNESGAEVEAAEGQVFVRVYGLDVGTGASYALTVTEEPLFVCEDDENEDDGDTRETALTLPSDVPIDAVSCPGDSDWYAIDILAGEALAYGLEYTEANGDLDLLVYLPGSAEPLPHGDGPEVPEEGTLIAEADGTVYFEVLGVGADGFGHYVLSASVGQYECTDDPFEPNESQEAAFALPASSDAFLSGELCAGDVDWYSMPLSAGDGLRAELLFVPSAGNLNLYLHGPDGQTEAASTSADETELIEFGVTQDGVYSLRVYGVEGDENPYFLALDVAEFVPPCEDDANEENDSRETATVVTLTDGRGADGGRSCDDDADWYAFPTATHDILTFDLYFEADGPQLSVELFDPSGAPLESVTGADGHAQISSVAATDGPHYVRVYSLDATARVDYTFTVDVFTPYICPDDDREENDEAAEATALTPGADPLDLRLCLEDEDWFTVTLAPRDTLALNVAFLHEAGDLDLELLDAGEQVVATSASADDDEQIVFESDLGGQLYARVYAAPEVENDYQISATVTPWVCPEDELEDNDDPATAARLTSGVPVDAAVCGGDEDWYSIAVLGGDGLQVLLDFVHDDGDLDLELWDATGENLLESSTSTTNDETIAFTAVTAGTYLLRVVGPEASLSYTLTATITAYACNNDAYEPSGAAAPAAFPGNGVLTDGKICIADEDWYWFTVAAGETIYASLDFVHSSGDLGLEVYYPDGELFGASDTANGSEQIMSEQVNGQVLAGGDYVARVFSAVPGTENTYDMTISVAPYTCTNDGFEDNDAMADATTIMAGQAIEALTCIGDEDWYAITVDACETIQFDLSHTFAEDSNLELALYDTAGVMVAESRSVTDSERIVYRAPIGGAYSLRVYAEQGTETTYSLSASVTAYSCIDDIHEENDSFAEARPIDVTTENRPGGRHCCNDDDWFAVTLEAGERLAATLCHDPAQGDLNVAIHGPDGAAIVQSETDVSEHVAYTATSAGTYVVAVTAPPGVDTQYQLWLDAGTHACTDDAFEDNDTYATRTPLPVAVGGVAELNDAALCTTDEDWFELTLVPGDLVNVDVLFAHPPTCPADTNEEPQFAGRDIDIEVVRPTGERLALGSTTTPNESVSFMAPTGGDYGLRVFSPVFADQLYDVVVSRDPFACLVDDGSEPNDSPGAARPIEDDPIEGWVCIGDEDWYRFSAAVGDTITVDLTFFHDVGDLKMELQNQQQTALVGADTATDDERIVYVAEETGTFWVRVRGTTDDVENRYQLAVNVDQYVCVDDGNEENDTQAQGPVIGADVAVEGQICPFDDDWYQFLLEPGDRVEIDLAFTHARGDLDLYLHRPDEVVLQASETRDDDEHISFVASSMGLHGIRIAGFTGQYNTYTLTITKNACDDDAMEPNDSYLDPLPPIMTDTAYDLVSCPSNEDCFPISLAQGDVLTAETSFDHANGDLNMRLYFAYSLVETAESSSPTANYEHIEYTAGAAGTAVVCVYGFSPLVQNTYALTLHVEGAGPTCTDDTYEPNDEAGQAPVLDFDTLYEGQICGLNDDWFAFDLSGVSGPQSLSLDATYTAGDGAASVTLFKETEELGAQSISILSPSATLSKPLVLPGLYTVRVSPTAGVTSTYTLTASATPWECIEEPGEDEGAGNDGFDAVDLSAPLIDFPVDLDAAVCAGDPDYYRLIVDPADHGKTLRVTVSFDQYDNDGASPHFSNLKVKLYNESRSTLAQAISTLSPQRIIRSNIAEGTYYLRIYGDYVAANLYNLSVTLE